ncbi:leucine-rich repeat neuronal protein 4 [Ochotona princeps]|uniref:leucine-rich repeat neuronal protein 4 n=1 Tax=Ochotona princeps TaxID=9978 RepID=UPI002714D542|nr:leucine-rich repeat neuronal protein 4 [Ochotona princeps]
MWHALLLLLLLPPSTVLRPGRAETSQRMVPIFWFTHQGPWASASSTTTSSPCEVTPAAATTDLNLANRSLELLPSCLPHALRSLDGSHNLLRALSAPELGHLRQLQVLTLHHNDIATLRWGPGGPAALHTLDLSYNCLAALPRCAAPELPSLRSLLLSGNPLQALQPQAFACVPELRLLNLSSTALGRGAPAAFAQAAFAGAAGAPLAIEVLDLSDTFLERVESSWMQDLPNLTHLYLRRMPRLRTLEGDVFKMTPHLQHLDCQDSPALASVHTAIFEDTPQLQHLLLQNCNLTSWPPWTLNSSQVLSISLFGNPLTCSCELSWLLMDTSRTVLSRAADTMCAPAAGSSGPFSAPVSLLQLPRVCQADRNTTLAAPNAHFFGATHTASTQGPAAASTQPAAGQRSITKASSLSGTPSSSVGCSQCNVPPRAASTARSEPGRGGGGRPHTPSSATATPLSSKPPSPVPTRPSSWVTPQPQQRTQSGARAPHPSPSEDKSPVFLTGDYSDEEEEEEGTLEEVRAPAPDVFCDYHPCRHLQTPCAELQRRSRCRCPGLSGEDVAPDPPLLQAVSETADTWALVHWCAPTSVVRTYQIRYSVEGQAGNQSVVADIPATARQHLLYGLSPATTYRVCVLAANRAGLSRLRAAARRSACTAFSTRPSAGLVLAGLGAVSGLLLLCSLVLAACLCRRCRTPGAPPPPDTHLVAYRNPVFDYPLKLQPLN